MSVDQKIILKIKNLRRRGLSIPEINRKCNIPKSTILRYIKGVEILPQYYQRWLDRRNSSEVISKQNWKNARQEADKIINYLNEKDLIMIGSLLYWAEGSKKDFSFCNTDPRMIRVFIYALKKSFDVKAEDLKVSLRIYEDLDRKACLAYWSKITNVVLDDNTSINILKGSKKGKLRYGMCRIRVRKGGHVFKKVFSIIEKIDYLISPRSSMDRTVAS